MMNLAGDKHYVVVDEQCENELKAAGINVLKMDVLRNKDDEVQTCVRGYLGSWKFERAWCYWVAEGPGIPHELAMRLHKKIGKECRCAGYAGGISPLKWYGKFGVDSYHVDSSEALKALAAIIKQLIKDSGKTFLFYKDKKHNDE